MIKTIIRKLYFGFRAVCCFGKKYRCPCCNKKFRKFLDFNYKENIYDSKIFTKWYKNTICPYCFSAPRHRIIGEFLNQNENIFTNRKKVLVFAIERSIKLYLNKNKISFKTADLYKQADLKIDITKINLENESFDIIFCNHVLEHVPSYQNALKELNRILTTNGILILSVPIDKNSKKTIEKKLKTDKERKKYYGQVDHLRIFGLNMKEIIEKYGFNVKEINGDNLDSKIVPVIGPAKYDYNHIFICYKDK